MSDDVLEFDSVEDVVTEFNARNGEILAPDVMDRLVVRIQEIADEFADKVQAVADVLLDWSPREVVGYSQEVESGVDVYATA